MACCNLEKSLVRAEMHQQTSTNISRMKPIRNDLSHVDNRSNFFYCCKNDSFFPFDLPRCAYVVALI